jgi:hypothetical protein
VNREETILFLREAVVAIHRLKMAAEAMTKHATECPVCRSKLRSYFWQCRTKDAVAFDWLTAKTETEHFQAEMRKMAASWEGAGRRTPKVVKGIPTVEWILELYKLPDPRGEDGI